MVFQEPKVAFVELNTREITASTGAGYSICERVNSDTNVGIEDYCSDMDMGDMPWDQYCATFQGEDANTIP